MSDKKHIDRLFQEKLKNFEASPSDEVWNRIHDSLHKKKRERRIVPIWWRVAGIAALLALLITVGNAVFNGDSNESENTVVDAPTSSEIKKNEDANSVSPNEKASQPNEIDDDTYDMVVDKNAQNASNEVSEEKSSTERLNNTNQNSSNSSVVSNNSQENSKDGNSKHNIIASDRNASQKTHSVASSDNDNKKADERNSNFKELNEIDADKKKTEVTGNFENIDNSNQNSVVENQNLPKNNSNLEKETSTKIDSTFLKTNVEKALADVDVDSLNQKEKEEILKKETTIEEAIAEANNDEDEDEEENVMKRWNISPNVAPVYFNSMGEGSPLDDQFVNNSKSGDVTMSYGIGGSYAISKNLKIRAGINKVDLGYSTNNVISYINVDSSSVASARIGNINLNDDAQGLTFMSAQTLNRSATPEVINTAFKGAIDQQFGFIEIPIEMEYALLNKKLGVNVIGGFSTFIVENNEIYAMVDGSRTLIGEADNVNNLSYSANFGLGLNYNISEKIKVNVEPTFKYQINTFNASSGDFRPYFIGVYTGLSYKF